MNDGIWLEMTIRYLGIATLSVVVLAAVVAVGLGLLAILLRFTPRLHYGSPQNPGELRFYNRYTITTGKDGQAIEGTSQLLNDPLKIKWWVGLSHRVGARWWLGVICFQPKAD